MQHLLLVTWSKTTIFFSGFLQQTIELVRILLCGYLHICTINIYNLYTVHLYTPLPLQYMQHAHYIHHQRVPPQLIKLSDFIVCTMCTNSVWAGSRIQIALLVQETGQFLSSKRFLIQKLLLVCRLEQLLYLFVKLKV